MLVKAEDRGHRVEAVIDAPHQLVKPACAAGLAMNRFAEQCATERVYRSILSKLLLSSREKERQNKGGRKGEGGRGGRESAPPSCFVPL